MTIFCGQFTEACGRLAKGSDSRVLNRPLVGKPVRIHSGCFLVLLSYLFLLGGAAAQELERLITPLSKIDQRFMDEQRQRINELTLRYYGGRCCRSAAELTYLQRLLDERRVNETEELELQAMGILLGDLLVREQSMEWIVFEDAQGRSRALRLADSENYLFPATMISRRRMAGDLTPVIDIYRKAVTDIESVKEPLPFQ
ncbi:MAG: DUF3806 domain-containing protein [Pseudomonadota bacterium]